MISPTLYVYDAKGSVHTVFGWWTDGFGVQIAPIVANPDGPGVGRWRDYHGEDPWYLMGDAVPRRPHSG
jgi:hypothetical protein